MRGIGAGAVYACQALGSVTAVLAGGAMITNNVGGNGNGWRCTYFIF